MKVYELLADPARWTKGAFARNAAGVDVFSNSPDACQWCLMGAINKCYFNISIEFIKDAIYAKIGNIGKWNDAPERTHADVINLCRELDI